MTRRSASLNVATVCASAARRFPSIACCSGLGSAAAAVRSSNDEWRACFRFRVRISQPAIAKAQAITSPSARNEDARAQIVSSDFCTTSSASLGQSVAHHRERCCRKAMKTRSNEARSPSARRRIAAFNSARSEAVRTMASSPMRAGTPGAMPAHPREGSVRARTRRTGAIFRIAGAVIRCEGRGGPEAGDGQSRDQDESTHATDSFPNPREARG